MDDHQRRHPRQRIVWRQVQPRNVPVQTVQVEAHLVPLGPVTQLIRGQGLKLTGVQGAAWRRIGKRLDLRASVRKVPAKLFELRRRYCVVGLIGL